MTAPTIEICALSHFEGLDLPAYATAGAAGMDVQAAIETDIILTPRSRVAVPTGLTMAIPQGFEVQVRPRSGLALRHGVTVANAPGTIDSDYRGEVKIILINLGSEPVTITRGMRIAQLVTAPVSQVKLKQVDTLSDTARGAGGFGSTGK